MFIPLKFQIFFRAVVHVSGYSPMPVIITVKVNRNILLCKAILDVTIGFCLE